MVFNSMAKRKDHLGERDAAALVCASLGTAAAEINISRSRINQAIRQVRRRLAVDGESTSLTRDVAYLERGFAQLANEGLVREEEFSPCVTVIDSSRWKPFLNRLANMRADRRQVFADLGDRLRRR